MASERPSVLAAAADTTTRFGFLGFCGRVVVTIPAFVYVAVVYAMLQTLVPDVRQPIFGGGWQLTAIEGLYIVAFLAAMVELLRVSKPGIDNTIEALAMTVVLIGYVVFFVLAVAGITPLAMFATSEFLVLTVLSGIQVGVAFLVNGRTLKRTIDYNAT